MKNIIYMHHLEKILEMKLMLQENDNEVLTQVKYSTDENLKKRDYKPNEKFIYMFPTNMENFTTVETITTETELVEITRKYLVKSITFNEGQLINKTVETIYTQQEDEADDES
tara:strand:+ start:513 stop:851 length:339 start_codon:yes stop_codon:yes gene_type:complete